MIRRITAVLLCFLLTLLIPQSAFAALVTDRSQGQITYREDNIDGNFYDYINNVNRSFFTTAADGYMRLYGADNGTVFVEYYDEEFRCINSGVIPTGLPIFGGFYEDDNDYYVLTGQDNFDEDDNREVYRLTRFNKNWHELGHASVFGADTTVPFRGGCDFALYNHHMIVRTARQMYRCGGEYRQANITLRFDVDTMTEEASVYGASSLGRIGFASRSFNQFVAVDTDGTVVCLDHADTNPRVALLGKFKKKADENFLSSGTQNYTAIPIVTYDGDDGDITTGANVGGLAISSAAYLTVGNSISLTEDDQKNGSRNVYLSVTPKDSFSVESTKIIRLSDHASEDRVCAANPHLVKLSDDRFLIMWDECKRTKMTGGPDGVLYDIPTTPLRMKYVFVDGNGNLDPAHTDETMINAADDPRYQIRFAPENSQVFVSGDEPHLTGRGVVWFYSDEDSIDAVAEMDLDGNITLHEDVIPKDVLTYPVDMNTANTVLKTFDPIPESLALTEDNLFDYIGVYKDGYELECGEDFRFSSDGGAPFTAEYEKGILKSIDPNIETVHGKSYVKIIGLGSEYNPYNFACGKNVYTAFNQNAGDIPTWTEEGVRLCYTFTRGVGYHIYRKEDGGAYEKIATFTNRGGTEYIDTTAIPGKRYWYTAREYTFDKNGNEILSEPLNAKTPDSPAVSAEPTFDGFRLSWDAMDGAEKYAVHEYDIEKGRVKYPALGITTDCQFEFRDTGYGVKKRYAVVAVDPMLEDLNIPENCRCSAYGLTPTLTLNNTPEITRCEYREDGMYIEWAPNEFADHYAVLYDRLYSSIKENHLLIKNVYNNESSVLYVVAEQSGSKSIQSPIRYVTYVAPDTDDWRFNTQFYSAQSGMITFTGWLGEGEQVTVPGDVLGVNEVILSKTFRNNTWLKKVILPENTSMLDYAFEGCSALRSITIPESAGYISDRCFAGCTSLRSVVFERGYPVWELPQEAFEGCGDITIYGYGSRSGACDIAKQFGFSYVDLEKCPLGDADGNGVVDIMDVTAIQYHLADLYTPVEKAVLMAGDTDNNGALDICDATYIQRYLAEMEIPFPIGTTKE